MASLSVPSFLLLLLMQMASLYCAPDTYGYSGTFGAVSHLNLTGRGSGTLKQKGLGVSGDTDGFIGAKWNGTLFSGGVVNYNDLYLGGRGSVSKVVEGSIKPGATFETGVGGTNVVPRYAVDKGSITTYDSEFVYGDDAKRLAESYGTDISSNSANGNPIFSFVCAMFCIAIVVRSSSRVS